MSFIKKKIVTLDCFTQVPCALVGLTCRRGCTVSIAWCEQTQWEVGNGGFQHTEEEKRIPQIIGGDTPGQ